MRRVGVEECVICAVKAMYENAKSCVCVCVCVCVCELSIQGVHQGVVRSPLLFIIVMVAL